MSDPFIAEIKIFAGNFPPRSWAQCDGQLFPISQNTALFSLLGTTYGGDGKSTFALPDLRGRSPMQPGQGPGLSVRDIGERDGTEQETLSLSQLPLHSHHLNAATAATTAAAANALLGQSAAKVYGPAANLVPMANEAIGAAGGGQPHENRQPYLTLNFIIALQGVFPSRG